MLGAVRIGNLVTGRLGCAWIGAWVVHGVVDSGGDVVVWVG